MGIAAKLIATSIELSVRGRERDEGGRGGLGR